jgi:hypothetical protein
MEVVQAARLRLDGYNRYISSHEQLSAIECALQGPLASLGVAW